VPELLQQGVLQVLAMTQATLQICDRSGEAASERRCQGRVFCSTAQAALLSPTVNQRLDEQPFFHQQEPNAFGSAEFVPTA